MLVLMIFLAISCGSQNDNEDNHAQSAENQFIGEHEPTIDTPHITLRGGYDRDLREGWVKIDVNLEVPDDFGELMFTQGYCIGGESCRSFGDDLYPNVSSGRAKITLKGEFRFLNALLFYERTPDWWIKRNTKLIVIDNHIFYYRSHSFKLPESADIGQMKTIYSGADHAYKYGSKTGLGHSAIGRENWRRHGIVKKYFKTQLVYEESIKYMGWEEVLHVEIVDNRLHVFGITRSDDLKRSDIFYHVYRISDYKLSLLNSVRLKGINGDILQLQY